MDMAAITGINLQTSRLLLREINPNDILNIHTLYSNPETSKYEDWEPYTEENSLWQTQQALEEQTQTDRKMIRLIVELKDGQFVGCVGVEISRTGTAAKVFYAIIPEMQ